MSNIELAIIFLYGVAFGYVFKHWIEYKLNKKKMSKDYLDKWEERQKQNTEIIEQQQAKTKKTYKELAIEYQKTRKEQIKKVIELLSEIVEQGTDLSWQTVEKTEMLLKELKPKQKR